MVMILVIVEKEAFTPGGSPVGLPIPVAPVVVCVMDAGSTLLIHTVGVEEAAETVLFGFTVIEPGKVTVPQPPVKVIVYPNTPETVGVPLMVITLADQLPVIPSGRLVMVAPVAPVVAYVILVIAVLIHTFCAFVPTAEVREMVLTGATLIVPPAVTVPHPPVKATV